MFIGRVPRLLFIYWSCLLGSVMSGITTVHIRVDILVVTYFFVKANRP